MKQTIVSICISFFLVITFFAFQVPFQVQAVADLTLVCEDEGPCNPNSSEPLFTERGWVPGKSEVKEINVVNTDQNDTCQLSLQINEQHETSNQLASKLWVAFGSSTPIYGQVDAGRVVGPDTFEDLFNLGNLDLGMLSPGASETFRWYVTLDPATGNEYQARHLDFDFDLTVTCEGFSPTPSPSVSPNTPTTGGRVAGSTSLATPQPCTAQVPVSPFLSLISIGVNEVTLSWTAVSPTTHYGILFTRLSDGVQYGSPNVGVNTTYTVTNLSGGGANYSFQVYAVNDCAPGEKSNTVQVENVPGIILEPVPAGFAEVLGEQSDLEQAGVQGNGAVLGVQNNCDLTRAILPLLLLVAQCAALGILFFLWREHGSVLKHVLAVGISIFITAIFYLLRNCNCLTSLSVLELLCQWYWVVALIILIGAELLQFLFIEDAN